jgi:serine/threonine protein kinase
MPLAVGERLGPYEILGPLGHGGMGEVYRARDARLRREVAVKVLREAIANDPDSLSRFRRETHAVAALNHPNILAIHDAGEQAGVPYAVTELLDGETLADRLAAGPLPSRRAAEIASQVADGLSAAHEKGIFHRDVKPANIFLTTGGRIKILDFGIARTEAAAPLADAAGTATQEASSRQLIGTVPYMSPEQLRGQPADGRSDIFALGAVLYEMLTGRSAFGRAAPAETISAILREDPMADREAAGLPPALGRLLSRCLEKEPSDRYQSARDPRHSPSFRRTVAGSLTRRTSPTASRSTRAPIRGPGGNCRRRMTAASSRSGVGMERSSSTGAARR